MLAPAGALESSANVSDCAGRSESVALAVKVKDVSSLLVRLIIGARTGGELVFKTTNVTRLRGAQWRDTIIGNDRGKSVSSAALGFTRCPGEKPVVELMGRAGRGICAKG